MRSSTNCKSFSSGDSSTGQSARRKGQNLGTNVAGQLAGFDRHVLKARGQSLIGIAGLILGGLEESIGPQPLGQTIDLQIKLQDIPLALEDHLRPGDLGRSRSEE